MEFERDKKIKEIEIDADEIMYSLKHYDLSKLNDVEIQELYTALSIAWLLLRKIA